MNELAKGYIRSSRLAIFGLVAPVMLFTCAFVALLAINIIFNPTFWMIPDGEAVSNTPLFITVLNAVFITVCIAGLLSFIPGLIFGTVLLTRKRSVIKKQIKQ